MHPPITSAPVQQPRHGSFFPSQPCVVHTVVPTRPIITSTKFEEIPSVYTGLLLRIRTCLLQLARRQEQRPERSEAHRPHAWTYQLEIYHNHCRYVIWQVTPHYAKALGVEKSHSNNGTMKSARASMDAQNSLAGKQESDYIRIASEWASMDVASQHSHVATCGEGDKSL
jgi:hypothetical protein